MNTATTRLTCATSSAATAWNKPGTARPRPTPARMPSATQRLRKRSNSPMVSGLFCADAAQFALQRQLVKFADGQAQKERDAAVERDECFVEGLLLVFVRALRGSG